MKRFLSIFLITTLVLSLTLTSTLSAGATSNEKAELAPTGAITRFISEEPYETITAEDFDNNLIVMVYGFIGDSDGDGNVSVMDSTAIQLHLASLSSLTKNGEVVSDVDRDSDVSILDATEIQLWLALLSDNPCITHTIYDLTAGTIEPSDDDFDAIVSFIKENGEYYSDGDSYHFSVEIYNGFMGISYYPSKNNIQVSSYTINEDHTESTSSSIFIDKGVSGFTFLSYKNNEDYEYLYDAWGKGELISSNPYKVSTDCLDFESTTASSYDKVRNTVESNICTMLTDVDSLLLKDTSYKIGDIIK